MTKIRYWITTVLFIMLTAFAVSTVTSHSAFAEEVCADGQCYEVDKNGNAVAGSARGCQPLPVKLAEIQTCLLCPLFQVILDADQTMATKSYDALAPSFRNVILMILALFIAYHTLLTVSSFTKQDAPKYITTLLTQAFKVIIAALLLSNSAYIYNHLINPLTKAGMEFGIALLFNDTNNFAGMTASESGAFAEGAIDTSLLGSVIAALKVFNKTLAEIPAIGSTLMCISWHAASWHGFPDMGMLIEGALIYVFGWAMILAASFYLLDSAVRFGIFCALLPFLIAAWPFKITRSYTKTGWDIFMNCLFNFITMGLVISVCSELIGAALGGTKDELIAAINGDEAQKLGDMMNIWSTQFLILIACCMFAFKLVGQLNDLANEISSTSGGTSIGGKIGGTVMSAGTKVAGTAAQIGYATSGLKGKVDNVKEKLGLKESAPQLPPQQNPNNNNNNSGNNSGGGNESSNSGGNSGGGNSGGGNSGGGGSGGDSGGSNSGGGGSGGGSSGGDAEA